MAIDDSYTVMHEQRSLRIVEHISNGNLTTAIDMLMDEDPVVAVIVALMVVERLVLEQVKSVSEVVGLLLRLIDTWSED